MIQSSTEQQFVDDGSCWCCVEDFQAKFNVLMPALGPIEKCCTIFVAAVERMYNLIRFYCRRGFEDILSLADVHCSKIVHIWSCLYWRNLQFCVHYIYIYIYIYKGRVDIFNVTIYYLYVLFHSSSVLWYFFFYSLLFTINLNVLHKRCLHWKKKWSHFDLKVESLAELKFDPGFQSSNWRIFESNWFDIESQINNLTLSTESILVPPMTQLFRSKWLHFFSVGYKKNK